MTWLIASMGLSPEVLTEAIYHLETHGKPVAKVTCVGTQTAQSDAEEVVFKAGGALDRLRQHLGKPDGWLRPGPDFQWETEALKTHDNRNMAEAKVMDRAFRRAILKAQAEGQGPVAACISGGRKTMSSSLQQAMALLARPADWAFVVLLDPPAGIDEWEVTRAHFAFPGDPQCPQFASVGIDAFEIPLVRLRALAATRGIDLADPKLVAKLQRAVDDLAVPLRLTLSLADRKPILILGNRYQVMPPLSLPHTLLLAAWIRAGKPLRPSECRKTLQEVHAEWKRLRVNGAAEEEKLMGYIRTWSSAAEVDKGSLQMSVSRLKTKLQQLDPLLEPYVIRSHSPKAVADPVYGFSPAVYEGDAANRPSLILTPAPSGSFGHQG